MATLTRNLFHGLVDTDLLQVYMDAHTSKDAIIPNILLHKYPPYGNGNGRAVVPAMLTVVATCTVWVYMDQIGRLREL